MWGLESRSRTSRSRSRLLWKSLGLEVWDRSRSRLGGYGLDYIIGFYTIKKIPQESTLSSRIYFEIFFKWNCGLPGLPQSCTFCHLLQLLLNWHINVVITVNSTHKVWNGHELWATTFSALSLVCAGWTELTSEIFCPNCFLHFGYQKCFCFP